MLRIGLPSDGALYEPALRFLASCGLDVVRPNVRSYTGEIPALPGAVVHFQRAADITGKVEDGSIDVGVVGYDRYLENRRADNGTDVIFDGLGFGGCSLVLAVPESWVDVTSVADLAEVSVEFRDDGMDMRVATKFPRLVEQFLLDRGVNYFSLVPTSGTLEAAPAMGYADLIADISSSGTTLRENRLKTLQGGGIIDSAACLIVNTALVGADAERMATTCSLVDLIEGHLQAQGLYTVTADVRGESAEAVARSLLDSPYVSGLRGPTISPVYTDDDERFFTVTVVVERKLLLVAVTHLRRMGGGNAIVSETDYVFHGESEAHRRLEAGAARGRG